MEVNMRQGQSFIAALGNEIENHGYLLDSNGHAFAEYRFEQVSVVPIQANFETGNSVELLWCHTYSLSKRVFDGSEWTSNFLTYPINKDEDEKRKLAAYDRAMKIL